MVRSTLCWSTRSRQSRNASRPPALTRLTSGSPTSLSARGSTLGSSGELCFYMVECNSDHFRRMNGKPSNLTSGNVVDSDVPERLASFEFTTFEPAPIPSMPSLFDAVAMAW